MIVDSADRMQTAVARVLAALVPAAQVEGTLVVRQALGSLASDVGVSSEVIGAVAPRPVIRIGPAQGVEAALGVGAGVYALPVDAGLGRGAVRIRTTSD